MVDDIFAEKYRPLTLDNVVGQENAIELLKEYVKKKDIPHMMFAGPAGVGKTTVAQALARDLYGSKWGQYFYEMNASDERKLKDVREKIKPYARTSSVDEDFRIIFLDEVDAMDKLGQTALRRIFEKYSKRCRFILSCNYPHKIIEPIKDRCILFRFTALSPDEMIPMLKMVAEKESIDINSSALQSLCKLSKGSMRRALGTFEKLQKGGITNIDEEVMEKYFCYIKDDDLKRVVKSVASGNINATSEYVEDLLLNKAYAPGEIIEAFERLLRESKTLKPEDAVEAYEHLGEVDFRISVGADAEIQLKVFFVSLYKQYAKYVGGENGGKD